MFIFVIIRQLALLLDMDTVQLSKIDSGERNTKKETVLKLAEIPKITPDELIKFWLANQIYDVVKNENTALKTMIIAEESVKHSKKKF